MYMPIFGNLNSLPIRLWDEARLSINAYEMLHDGQFIVTHFDGSPDMWNTKPPLMIWSQVFFMKIIGVNELAIRLPSAIAAFLTCCALIFFTMKYLKSFWLGFIAVFVLITTQGYIQVHASRTGDYDCLVTLFTTLQAIFIFLYCENKKNKYLYLFFIATTCAVLTKSITGLMFLPAMAIYCAIVKMLVPTLKNKHFYIGLSLFIIVALGYYFVREFQNPGYLLAVYDNELGGRFLDVKENHQQDFWFYFNRQIESEFNYWHLLLPCGVLIGFVLKNKLINRLTLLLVLLTTSFLLIISSAKTKIEWYDLPLYPFYAIIVAFIIHFVFEALKKNPWIIQQIKFNAIPLVFLFLIGVYPYQEIFKKTYKPTESGEELEFYEMGNYLQKASRGKFNLDDQHALYEGYQAHLDFYLKVLIDQGHDVKHTQHQNLTEGDIAFTQDYQIQEYIAQHYDFEIIRQQGRVITYKILSIQEKNSF